MLFLLLLPLVFFISNSKESRHHNILDRTVVWISSPVQSAVVATLEGVTAAWNRYIYLVNVLEDNERLKKRNAELRAALEEREEQRQENERLRALLNVRDRFSGSDSHVARVIATSPNPLFRSIRVSRGRDDGVVVGLPVINQEGVVGRVATVTAHTADILLLVDPNSSVDALVRRSRSRARVRGFGRDDAIGISVQYLERTADVEPGDTLVTSAVGNFPKGIKIGVVTAVERGKFGLYQRADLEPAVDFGRLEEVMIIVPKPEAFQVVPEPEFSPPLAAEFGEGGS